MDNVQEEALRAHNRLRSKHEAAPLTFSAECAKHAQKWADHLAKTDKFEHSENKDFGENIATGFGSGDYDLSVEQATENWYSEIRDYDFSKPGFKSGIGHFTQVVWKATKEMGIGKAKSKKGRIYIVANYKPAGNMMRDFAVNVIKGTGSLADIKSPPSAGNAKGNSEKKTGPLKCAGCTNEITKYYETKDGRCMCEDCYKKKEASKCAGCNDPVIGEIISAMESKWHAKCFVCTECKKPFDGPFIPKDGKPYCKKDYEKLFMGGKSKPEKCHGCKEKLETKWIEAMDKPWHPGCFKCAGCKKALEGESFFKKNDNPYCGDCVNK
nr:PREDICTED: LIM and cysteine-rich domains protein 1-like isoform X1 [Saccoglossus kowalevskii]